MTPDEAVGMILDAAMLITDEWEDIVAEAVFAAYAKGLAEGRDLGRLLP